MDIESKLGQCGQKGLLCVPHILHFAKLTYQKYTIFGLEMTSLLSLKNALNPSVLHPMGLFKKLLVCFAIHYWDRLQFSMDLIVLKIIVSAVRSNNSMFFE